jgi:hypothetical protein
MPIAKEFSGSRDPGVCRTRNHDLDFRQCREAIYQSPNGTHLSYRHRMQQDSTTGGWRA